MKILVLGAGGMAGHVISLYLRDKGHEVDTLSNHNKIDDNTIILDVTDRKKLDKVLDKKHYDAIINCIGLLVKKSEEYKDLASYINSYLPHYLESKYKDSNTKIVHLSTDCVFSGKNPPYTENSPYSGETFYDRSKALGEIINDKDLTFRMSIIGPEIQEKGIGLFNWFYSQTGEIGGYTKSIWTGVTTTELARAIESAIKQDLTGLYHLVPKNNISKYELVKLIADIFDRSDITIKPNDSVIQDKTLINTRTDFDFTVQTYKEMLTQMKKWIKQHHNLYPHYEKE